MYYTDICLVNQYLFNTVCTGNSKNYICCLRFNNILKLREIVRISWINVTYFVKQLTVKI